MQAFVRTFAIAIALIGTTLNHGCAAAPLSETGNSTANSNVSTKENPVMFSYSEAVVDEGGKPAVSQLTILKGKDGEFHYAKNTNGNIKKGKWNGPLPTTPGSAHLEEISNSTIKNLTDELIDPIHVLQESIGSSVQDFLLKNLNF